MMKYGISGCDELPRRMKLSPNKSDIRRIPAPAPASISRAEI
jgi:hypothetical protein